MGSFRAPRVDANQKELVRAIRLIGCTVKHLHAVGDGCPDLLIGFKQKNYLCEVKDPAKTPSQRKLTPAQKEFHADWLGQVRVIETINDVMEMLRND